jgi:predicted secreted protein
MNISRKFKDMMPTAYIRVLYFLGLVLASPFLSAADIARLDFLGFSRDGAHLVFEQYGDGFNAPYSELYFIEVAGNRWAHKPLLSAADENGASLAQLRQRNRQAARDLFAELEISGSRHGQHLVSQSLHNLSADPHQVRFTPALPPTDENYTAYSLVLTEQDAGSDCGTAGSARMFTLRLRNEDSDSETILQQDRRLPSSRGCVLGYRIQDMYLYEQSVAVFLNIFLPGLEGQSMRYLVVTGTLP